MMDGCRDAGVDVWMNAGMDECRDGCMDECRDGWMQGWIDSCRLDEPSL